MTLEITQKDIENADNARDSIHYKSINDCPISQALKRTYDTWDTCSGEEFISYSNYSKTEYFVTSKKAIEIMRAWDRFRICHPCIFDLESLEKYE